MSDQPQFLRAMGLPHATALVVGTIIGASIFVQPSEVMKDVPTVGGVLMVWVAAGVLTLFGALICAELASTFATTGGVYVYLKEAYSPAVGFLWGWAMFFVMHSGIIAAIALVTAKYSSGLVPLGDEASRDVWTKVVAIGVIVLWSLVNYLGVRHGSRLQTAFTFAKVVAILLIIVVGFALGGSVQAPASPHPETPQPGASLGGFLAAVGAGLFAYGGWHMVTYNAEETLEPQRTIPLALVFGTVLVTLCYVAMNGVYLYVLPLHTVVHSDKVAAEFAEVLVGGNGKVIMSALVVFSCFGAINGIILCGPRVYYAMARDGLAFRWLAGIHPRFRTPHRAIVLQAVWSSVLVATGTYREIFKRVIEVEWIFFAAMAVGMFVFRRRGLPRAYSVWGYPVVPVVFAVCACAIAIGALVTDEKGFLIAAGLGLGPVLLGLPVYHLWVRRRRR